MTWSLIAEFGLDYPLTHPGQRATALSFPALLQRHGDGTYLIVDELFFGKYLSVTAECRTIRVDGRGDLVYDSFSEGIHDGYGCSMDHGEMALLRRTRWQLVVLSSAGGVTSVIDLTTISKEQPRLVTWTWRKTFLVAFCRTVGRVDIAEIDRQGRLLWYLRRRDPVLGFPGSLQLLPNGNVLVADEFHHVAAEVRPDGSWAWQFGTRGRAAPDERSLSNPKAITQAGDGYRLIADTRNHRIICLERDGTIGRLEPPSGAWSSPSYACKTQDGHFLVCDAGNKTVLERDARGHLVWQYGRRLAERRWLSFPRSVEVLSGGSYLVADTGNNRVLEVSPPTMRECPVTSPKALFWPRCARRLPSGHLLIADGRNSRILEVSPAGTVCRELTSIRLGETVPLGDPHDVRLLPNGHLLVTDAARNLVVEVSWSGQVYWAAGDQVSLALKDPHSAQRLPGGDTLICDTGSSRLLRVDESGKIIRTIEAVHAPSEWLRLIRPRYAEMSADGVIIVADSDNNRIVASSLEGEYRWMLSSIPQSPLPTLNQPRWVQAVSANEVIVSDTLHHRILHLRRLDD